MTVRFKTQGYAAEELIAELASAFMCAEFGLTSAPRPDHAAYIKNWLQLLKDDNRAIFTAAAKASQAVAYLHAQVDGSISAGNKPSADALLPPHQASIS